MTVHGLHREASIEIHASPEAVYALVSDLPRMGEWSPENIGGEWQNGALVPFRVTQPSFCIYAAFCIKKISWSAKPWSRIPRATAGT